MTDDSPYQDAKDAFEGAKQAVTKTNDFVTHSTSKLLGPASTWLIKVIKGRWGKKPEETEIP